MKNEQSTVWVALVLFAFAGGGGCAKNDPGDPGDPSLRPTDYPVAMTLSDLPDRTFAGTAAFAATSVAEVVVVRFNVWSDEVGFVGTSVTLDATEMASLVEGEEFVVENFWLNVGDPTMPIGRPIVTASLALDAETRSATLTLGLGAAAPGGTLDDGRTYDDLAPTASFRAEGPFEVYCSVADERGVLDDPTWSSEFCRMAASELSLGVLRDFFAGG